MAATLLLWTPFTWFNGEIVCEWGNDLVTHILSTGIDLYDVLEGTSIF